MHFGSETEFGSECSDQNRNLIIIKHHNLDRNLWMEIVVCRSGPKEFESELVKINQWFYMIS